MLKIYIFHNIKAKNQPNRYLKQAKAISKLGTYNIYALGVCGTKTNWLDLGAYKFLKIFVFSF